MTNKLFYLLILTLFSFSLPVGSSCDYKTPSVPSIPDRQLGSGALYWESILPPDRTSNFDNLADLVLGMRGAPLIEPKPHLQKKTVTLTKVSQREGVYCSYFRKKVFLVR